MSREKLPQLTESIVRALTTPQSFSRGQELYRADAITDATRQANVLTARCEGTMAPYYRVTVTLDDAGVSEANCTCDYEYGGLCKHVVALLLMYIHKPKSFAARQAPENLLNDLSREELRALVLKLLEREPELYDWIQAMTAAPAASSKTKTARKKKVDDEVYRRQARNVLHSLDGVRGILCPRHRARFDRSEIECASASKQNRGISRAVPKTWQTFTLCAEID